jgi:hypothetical protein
MGKCRRSRVFRWVLVLAAVHLFSGAAHAFDYESPISGPCHERLTVAALRRLRAELQTAAPIPASAEDRRIIDDVVFSLPADMRDIDAVTLLLGVRDNDVKGRSGIDSNDLAEVHADPDTQREHCLRRSSHDEPQGTAQAVAACRAYILERFDEAVRSGLDAQGHVARDRSVQLPVHLVFRGRVRLALPLFFVRMGQGLHALQDSFSHSYRTGDHLRITAVLNYVDTLEHHDEAIDGPTHARQLDGCADLDPFLTERFGIAQQATTALLRTALDPSLSVDDKQREAGRVLDTYLSVQPGCTAANAWCDAPEAAYRSDCACEAVGQAGPIAGGWLFLLVGVIALSCRRLRRPGAAALALAVVLAAPSAEAHEPRSYTPDSRTGPAVHASVAGAFDNGALAFVLAGRYAVTNRWLLGLDGEYNPWFSIEGRRFARGAFNGYATIIHRFPVSAHIALRTTFHIGTSVLLFDLVGAPKGSVGPYVGSNLLGLSYELDDGLYLIIDPADVAWPAPQLAGAPFSYRQYRFTLGIQAGG